MSATQRQPLTLERILTAAIALADERGIDALTMRALADRLGVKPMAIYYYVSSKDQILNELIDRVFTEIDLPRPGQEWKQEMRRRCSSARAVLTRHSWVIGLMESRLHPGPATLYHHDRMAGTLRQAGFSVRLAAHAYALLDSYVYGFATQEASLPFTPETADETVRVMMDALPEDAYPYLREMAETLTSKPNYSFGDEFEFGLELILSGLEQALTAEL